MGCHTIIATAVSIRHNSLLLYIHHCPITWKYSYAEWSNFVFSDTIKGCSLHHALDIVHSIATVNP